jgi:recombinational DNA repair ATPase RecF
MAGSPFAFSQELLSSDYGEAGNVEQLNLVNFMSHENFEMRFCPGVNFIIGENGSGKSAVLTALCVALVCAQARHGVLRCPARTRAAPCVARRRTADAAASGVER